jgi:hypothetical protein
MVTHPVYHRLSSTNYTTVADNHLVIARSYTPLVAVFVKVQRGRNDPSYLPRLVNPRSRLPCWEHSLIPEGRSNPRCAFRFQTILDCITPSLLRVFANTLEGRSPSPASRQAVRISSDSGSAFSELQLRWCHWSPSSITVMRSYLRPLVLKLEQRTH